MNDRELLEMAAKAAGEWPSPEPFEHVLDRWNPLTDDGDALRLAVKLRLLVDVSSSSTKVTDGTVDGIIEMHRINRSAEISTRRAIVRAAAEIGKAMP